MKTFFKSLAGIIAICFLAATIVIFLLWSRVPDMAASELSKSLKVGVEIGDISLSLDNIKVMKLNIENPRNFRLERAFSTQELDFHAPLTSYLKNDIVIDEIDLDNVYLGLEFDSPRSANGNWTTIMKNAGEAQTKSSQSKSEKTVLIKRLILTNIHADILYQSEGKIRHLPVIPRMELTNISSKGGDLKDQLMNSALGQMLKEIFIKENIKDVMDQIFQNLPDNSQPAQILKGIKGLFGDAED